MQKNFKRALAVSLASVMVASTFSVVASAAYNKDYQSETHTVFKHTEQTLAPGVEYYNNYAYASDGKQMVYYVATADISRDDVVVQTSYLNQYKDKQPGMSKLSEQIAFANTYYTDPENELYLSDYYTVVAGVNASFYNMQTGQPTGVCFVDGVDFGTNAYPCFFAITKDGKAIMDDRANKGNYDIWQAVGGSQWLVRDSADVTATISGDYNTDRHSRTCVGITEDGKVVLMVLDGRQEPFSCGGTMHELAQIMLEAGCVYAMNIDGGGSTTFAARPEGENAVKTINRPSDGSERSISSGLIIASMAAPSDVFNRAAITVADQYITPGSETEFTVTGVSPAGTAAEIPAEVTYQATNGSVSDGKFISDGTVGEAKITAVYNGEAVGSATVNVVVPESIEFTSANFTIPYGKSAELGIVAKYGLNEVKTKASDFNFTVENPAAGTIDGFTFNAAGESDIAATSVTAALNGTELTASAGLVFGKGSEVIFDFEDGTTNGFNLSYSNYNYYLPNSKVFVADKDNGKVHSGNYALGLNIDYSNSQESGYQMTGLYQGKVSGAATNYEGALKLGTWLYIPDEYVGLWVRWVVSPITAVNVNEETGEKTYTYGSINSNVMDNGAGGTGVVYSFDESGWHYLTVDLSQYKGLGWRDFYYCMQFYISDRDGASYGYYAKNQHNINGDFTVYMDDVTVDYSTVVEDREAPVFSQVILGDEGPHSNEGLTLTNGYVSDGYSKLDLSARVAENTEKDNYSGLDASSAQILIDGNPVSASIANGIMVAPTYDFAEGQHTVKFIICDKAGNRASATRTFTVVNTDKAEAVKVVAHDPSLDRILHGSLYWVDVVAANAEKIDTITTTLNLDSMSKWELDHMTVANGFEASYEVVDAGDKIVKLTITNNGSNLAGEQALVSMPIRAWELNNSQKRNPLSNKAWTYAEFKASKEFWPVATEVRVQQGEVNFTDGSKDSFTGENVFVWSESWANYANMTATAEGKEYHNAWNGGHIHTPVVTKEAKAPTCTEDGWTEETFCEECNSVVAWSETVPATGHTYDFVPAKKAYFIINDGTSQTVDIPFNGGIGVYPTDRNDSNAYNIGTFDTDAASNTITFSNSKDNGAAKLNGTPNIYYWYDGETPIEWPGVPMTSIGQNEYGEEQYTFEMPEIEKVLACTICGDLFNGEYTDGKFYVDGIAAEGFVDGKYYIDGVLQKYNGIVNIDGTYYEFDENNASTGLYTGLVNEDGKPYYSKLGKLTSGWFEVGEDWYYFMPDTLEGANGVVKNENKVAFEFENGKLLHGVWEKTIGKYRYWYGPTYYHLTSRNVAYLEQEIDGAMYLFDEGGYRATGIVNNHESNSRTLNWFDCGEDGKATKLTGPQILSYNNKLYYVDENGDSPAGYGLVKVDGDYYYVVYDGSVKVNGDRVVEPEKTHDLLPTGNYHFDETGKITNVPVLNGVDENGYYRENGKIQKSAYLVKVEDDYYFVLYNGKVLKDADRTLSTETANGLLPAGTYHFGSDGKMTTNLNGIGDDGYYRVDGVVQKAAYLTMVDGDYYFVLATGKILRDADRTLSAETANGLLPAGTYHFGPDGKMTTVLNGVDEDGYYRENGIIQKSAYLVKVNDDYYFVLYTGKVLKDADRTVSTETANGLLPAGTYHFGPDGKMTTNLNGIGEDGYYRIDGVVQKAAYLIEIDGDYYFVLATGKILKNADRFLSAATANYLLPAGTYHFGEDGKMTNPPVAN